MWRVFLIGGILYFHLFAAFGKSSISLVASDDSDLALLYTPLTSVVRWKNTEVGRTCAFLLLERMKGKSLLEPRRIVVSIGYLPR